VIREARLNNVDITPEMIEAGVDALEGHLVEDGLNPLSRQAADFKPAPRPEQVGDERPKQMEDGKHRAG
jgi:hypothetical protein